MRFLLSVLLGLVCGSEAWAAQFVGLSPVIGGESVGCRNTAGPVVTIERPGLRDVAMAQYAGAGQPAAILLNPAVRSLPAPLALFIYGHECGHHVVGPNEAQSDCWAIQTGRRQGWFTESDISYLQTYFGKNPGDWTHAPGPQRVANLIDCFNRAGGGSSSGASRPPARSRDALATQPQEPASASPRSSPPSASRDRAINDFLDAINDLPLQELMLDGKLSRTHKYRATLPSPCVVRIEEEDRFYIPEHERGRVIMTLPLANLTVDATPLAISARLRFQAPRFVLERRGWNGESERVQVVAFSLASPAAARNLRDLAQAAIRECSQ